MEMKKALLVLLAALLGGQTLAHAQVSFEIGPTRDGAAIASAVDAPVVIGGKDSSGNAQTLAIGSDGALTVTTSGGSTGAAVTIDTSFTAQAADFTIEAATANLRLQGFSIRESAGTAAVATVVLRHDADGTCDSTAVAAFIELNPNESVQMWYGDRGLAIPSGLCADVLAGTVDFVLFKIAE